MDTKIFFLICGKGQKNYVTCVILCKMQCLLYFIGILFSNSMNWMYISDIYSLKFIQFKFTAVLMAYLQLQLGQYKS